MATFDSSALADLRLDYVQFYVSSLDTARDWLARGYGLAERPVPHALPGQDGLRTAEFGVNDVRLVVAEPADGDNPGAAYVRSHGDGVGDIALRVPDARAAFAAAVARGASVVSAPVDRGSVITATIGAFGSMVHTFVEYVGEEPGPIVDTRDQPGSLLLVDHFAACFENGTLEAAVEFYRDVLDFQVIFTEDIEVGAQAMRTTVVQSRSATVTFTLIEPDTSREPGHIDGFLKDHGAAGVQHVAFATNGITAAVDAIQARGIQFMGTPDSYYEDLHERVVPELYSVPELQRRRVLVDEDHDGQLYQIFAQSVHPRNTIFLELIERMGAQSFGAGNITALYEAAERQRDAKAA